MSILMLTYLTAHIPMEILIKAITVAQSYILQILRLPRFSLKSINTNAYVVIQLKQHH